MTMADPRKRERRGHHARVPDRHELLDPVPGLRLEEIDRVRPVGRGAHCAWLPLGRADAPRPRS